MPTFKWVNGTKRMLKEIRDMRCPVCGQGPGKSKISLLCVESGVKEKYKTNILMLHQRCVFFIGRRFIDTLTASGLCCHGKYDPNDCLNCPYGGHSNCQFRAISDDLLKKEREGII